MKNISWAIAIILAVSAIVGWYLAGSPIPGRYQIVNSENSVVMVDTLTGKIRLFAFDRAGDSRFRSHKGNFVVVELTK